MSASPKLVLDEESVATILALPSATRRRILAVLYQLRQARPQDTEDYTERDATGRLISVKAIRPVMIHYWLDGAVAEFRVIRVTLVKPWSR